MNQGLLMTRSTVPRPTDAELEILRVLWTRGPSTVRDVHEELSRRRATGYTTVLKLLQIMTEKGLTQRDERERAHVYEARLPQEDTERQLVGDLMDRAFGGSAARLVMQALSGGTASSQDLSDIRRLIDELEEEGR
jgi:predicted transcriptional regulator